MQGSKTERLEDIEDTSTKPDHGVVAFYCPRYNLAISVNNPASYSVDPSAPIHPEAKVVKFEEGFFSTDDPEVITFLDARSDVYRLDDPRVAALEETAGMEPEEREKALRLLEKVGGVGSFEKRRVSVPSIA